MLEREIERRLGARLRKAGCMFLKFVSPGNVGVPDRIVITPDGRLYFVELKTDDGRLSKMQTVMHAQLRAHGQAVKVLHGMRECMEFANMICGRNADENVQR